MKSIRKALAFGLVLTTLAALVTGCGNTTEPISNSSKPNQNEQEQSQPLTDQDIQNQIDYANSDAKNDTDVGLKTIKLDTAMAAMTKEQLDVVKYFDNDYFEITDYEFLRRYPQVFDEAQVSETGTVQKVLAQNGNQYEILLWCGWEFDDPDKKELILLKGETNGPLFIEGDQIGINGRYGGIETITVDGESMTIPVIDVYDAYMYLTTNRFDFSYIKSVAKSIFGENIEVRKLQGEELNEWVYEDFYYVAELDNQSNAKLSKFYFDTSGGHIWDATQFDWDSPIERHIEFTADFKHFYVLSYDYSLETFTVECYNQELKKEWKREFEEVQAPESEGLMDRIYDYTKNNFYIAINNELHIINAETGEDTFAPAYVGPKVSVNKLQDGILLVSNGKADALMKVDLNGQMIWKTNVATELFNVCSVQGNKDNLVIYTVNEDGYHYYVVDNKTGAMIVDAITMQ